MTDAAAIIQRLGLKPHPEGGWYRETWRSAEALARGRAAATAILYLLEEGQRSHWHRLDAEEMWIFQAGAPLLLLTADDGVTVETRLGVDIGESPQHRVRKGEWQSALAEDGWTLVACIVSPGFQFDGFELAPRGWKP